MKESAREPAAEISRSTVVINTAMQYLAAGAEEISGSPDGPEGTTWMLNEILAKNRDTSAACDEGDKF